MTVAKFAFLAKQGQHNQIARLLAESVGKPRLSQYNGPRGQGVLIELPLPEGVSKRSVDQLLHRAGVPGAVSRANRMRVFRANGGYLDLWDVAEKIGLNVPFKLSRDGKLRTAMVEYYDFGCECCGGYHRLVDSSGKPL